LSSAETQGKKKIADEIQVENSETPNRLTKKIKLTQSAEIYSSHLINLKPMKARSVGSLIDVR
jgi:hypothetical protein